MRSKILVKTLISVLMPMLISVIALGVLSMAIIYQYMESDMIRTNMNLLNSSRYNIELIMRDLDLYSHNFSSDPNIISKTKELMSSDVYNYDMKQNILFIRNFIDTPVNTQPYLYSAYVYYYGYKKLLCTDAGLVDVADFYDTEWLDELQNAQPDLEIWFEPRKIKQYSYEKTTDIISLNCKLHSPGSRKGEGLLTLNLRADYVSELLGESIHYSKQSILVIDSRSQVVFRSGADIGLPQPQLEGICLNKADYFSESLNGVSYRIYKTYSPQYGFTVISLLPSSTYYGVARQLLDVTIFVISAVIIAGIAIAYAATNKNRKQILNIINILDEYERTGKYPGMMPNAVDEYDFIIGNILKTFIQNNQMKMQLKEDEYKMDLYKLKALQVQINPHFLYNALEIVNWKSIETSGGYCIVNEMIDNLSSILKYCLSNPEEKITLEKEIHYTKCYMSIQNIRYNNKFDLIWEYDEDVLPLQVLKLLFQPLVENSINHGIRYLPGKGLVKIRIRRRGAILDMCIIDNGVGMDKEQLADVRKSLEKQWQDDMHIGLINTNQRLRLFYGEKYTIRLRSKKDWGTSVRFTIPFEQAY
jgi:two-component system sensor histidine kinase YesM